MEIILASQSPRRKEILKNMGLKFKVCPSRINEDMGARFSVAKLKNLAIKKAKQVAKKFKKGLVIGADTVVVLKGKIYGKPKNIKDAKRILGDLSGTTQFVWTAVAMFDIETGKSKVKAQSSKVKMKKLSPKDIDRLAAKNLDKAGAYAVQEDDEFIEKIEGSFTNVVGFPMETIKEMFGKLDIKVH